MLPAAPGSLQNPLANSVLELPGPFRIASVPYRPSPDLGVVQATELPYA
jgi:hypothetical protein